MKAGIEVQSIEIGLDGKIVLVVAGKPITEAAPEDVLGLM